MRLLTCVSCNMARRSALKFNPVKRDRVVLYPISVNKPSRDRKERFSSSTECPGRNRCPLGLYWTPGAQKNREHVQSEKNSEPLLSAVREFLTDLSLGQSLESACAD